MIVLSGLYQYSTQIMTKQKSVYIVGPNILKEPLDESLQNLRDAGVEIIFIGDGQNDLTIEKIIDGLIDARLTPDDNIIFDVHGYSDNSQLYLELQNAKLTPAEDIIKAIDFIKGKVKFKACQDGPGKHLVQYRAGNSITTGGGKKYPIFSAMSQEENKVYDIFCQKMLANPKYQRLPNDVESFLFCKFINPETSNFSKMVNGHVKFFSVNAPQEYRQPLEEWIDQYQTGPNGKLTKFMEFCCDTLGYKEQDLVTIAEMKEMLPDGYLQRYAELAAMMEAGRFNTKKPQNAAQYLTSLLKAGVDTKCKLIDGTAIIHMACSSGNIELVDFLLARQDMNINQMDNYGQTPLGDACVDGNLDVISRLLEKKADISLGAYNVYNPLMSTAHAGKMEIVDLLLQHITDPEFLKKTTDLKKAKAYCKENNLKMPEEHLKLMGKSAEQLALEKGYTEIADKINAKFKELKAISKTTKTEIYSEEKIRPESWAKKEQKRSSEKENNQNQSSNLPTK
jgi:hypothetical protein